MLKDILVNVLNALIQKKSNLKNNFNKTHGKMSYRPYRSSGRDIGEREKKKPYLLSIVDHFSKLWQSYPLKNKKS